MFDSCIGDYEKKAMLIFRKVKKEAGSFGNGQPASTVHAAWWGWAQNIRTASQMLEKSISEAREVRLL